MSDTYYVQFDSDQIDDSDNSVLIRLKSRPIQIRDHLRNLGNLKSLSEANRIIYQTLSDELDKIQKECWHEWEYVHLFVSVRAICSKCDLEYKNYNHIKDYKKLPSGRLV